MSAPTFLPEDLTFHVDAECTLMELAKACAAHHQTAPFEVSEGTVGQWIESGMKGAPSAFSDPVAQTLVGLEGRLHDGTRISLRPCPRRAAGPDLRALFVGQRARFGHITGAWLYVGPRKAAGPSTSTIEPSATSNVERDLLARLAAQLSPGISPRSDKSAKECS